MVVSSPDSRRGTALLLLGLVVGMVASLVGILSPSIRNQGMLEPGTVASVNGRSISRQDLQVALGGLGRGRKQPLTDSEKTQVLRRLIEEELLVQRAEALGLARVDRAVRKSMTTAMLDAASLDAEGRIPSPQELESFFLRNRDRFRGAGALRVDRLYFSSASDPDTSAERAQRALRRLDSGARFEVVRTELADPSVMALPQEALSLSTLREYVGPTAVQALASSDVGAVVGPLPSPGGLQVLRVRARTDAEVTDFADVRALVEEEWAREAADSAVREVLESLWRSADIVFSEDAPR